MLNVSNEGLVNLIKEFEPEEVDTNDLSYGRFFADVFRDVAAYNTTTNSWYVYNGKIWANDDESMGVYSLAKRLCDGLLMYAATMQDGSVKNEFVKWIGKYTVLKNRETMIRDARSEYYMSKDELDVDIYAFNCQNGTICLKTFEHTPHNAESLISKIGSVSYDPEARCERWEQFIDEVMEGDTDKINYFQKLLGYSLTGLTEVEQLFILYGKSTRNGKSTALETFSYMLGGSDGYALTIAPETLAIKVNKDSRSHSTDVARLRGARFINAPEPPSRMLLDSALVKTWTGNDTISAREIFEKQSEFRPQFKLFMNTNFLPIVDKTLFASNRINVIEFNRHFEQHEQDPTLKATLRQPENLSGILNWCLRGLKAYYTEGLIPPQCVLDANREYCESSDKIQQFINDCLTKTDKNEKGGTVYNAYKKWCDECEIHPLSKSNFYEEMKTKKLHSKTGTVQGKTEKNVIIGYEIANDETWEVM